ncbi:MAG TPA: Gfo/Idh/MocA family oxidoreductase [Candidatus Eisenbacteria bacterium]
MPPVRVGVWGVGAWGEKHARVYASLAPEGARLVGLHDRHPGRAAAVAARYGGRAFDSADELLEACEAVSVAVPTVAHRAATEQALAAGCHVLVEKPIATSVAEADLMIAAAQRHRRLLQVGHVERFNPALMAARSEVRAPKFIEAHRLAVFQPRSLDIDVVFDLMIHDIDIVLDVVGAYPVTLSAVGVAVLSPKEDIANARLEFEDGCVANLTASRVSQERLRRLRFFQSDAYLALDLGERTGDWLWVDPAAAAGAHTGSGAVPAIHRRTLPVVPGEPLQLQLQAFLNSTAGRGDGAASARAGREALRVAEAVQEAMKRRAGMWVAR